MVSPNIEQSQRLPAPFNLKLTLGGNLTTRRHSLLPASRAPGLFASQYHRRPQGPSELKARLQELSQHLRMTTWKRQTDWNQLHSLPDDDDCRFGVEQVSPRTVKCVVGTRTVARDDLLTMCILHLCFIEDMEVRFSGAAAGEQGSPIRYSRKALDAEATIKKVVNRVEYQNGVAGPRVSPERASIYDLSSVFWYPRRWGLRPSPDAYRRA